MKKLFKKFFTFVLLPLTFLSSCNYNAKDVDIKQANTEAVAKTVTYNPFDYKGYEDDNNPFFPELVEERDICREFLWRFNILGKNFDYDKITTFTIKAFELQYKIRMDIYFCQLFLQSFNGKFLSGATLIFNNFYEDISILTNSNISYSFGAFKEDGIFSTQNTSYVYWYITNDGVTNKYNYFYFNFYCYLETIEDDLYFYLEDDIKNFSDFFNIDISSFDLDIVNYFSLVQLYDNKNYLSSLFSNFLSNLTLYPENIDYYVSVINNYFDKSFNVDFNLTYVINKNNSDNLINLYYSSENILFLSIDYNSDVTKDLIKLLNWFYDHNAKNLNWARFSYDILPFTQFHINNWKENGLSVDDILLKFNSFDELCKTDFQEVLYNYLDIYNFIKSEMGIPLEDITNHIYYNGEIDTVRLIDPSVYFVSSDKIFYINFDYGEYYDYETVAYDNNEVCDWKYKNENNKVLKIGVNEIKDCLNNKLYLIDKIYNIIELVDNDTPLYFMQNYLKYSELFKSSFEIGDEFIIEFIIFDNVSDDMLTIELETVIVADSKPVFNLGNLLESDIDNPLYIEQV